jgi:hypothetical protein
VTNTNNSKRNLGRPNLKNKNSKTNLGDHTVTMIKPTKAI